MNFDKSLKGGERDVGIIFLVRQLLDKVMSISFRHKYYLLRNEEVSIKRQQKKRKNAQERKRRTKLNIKSKWRSRTQGEPLTPSGSPLGWSSGSSDVGNP